MAQIHEFNPEKARELVSTAHLLIKTNRYEDAIAALREVVDRYEPQNVDAHIMAGCIYAKMRMPKSVLKIMDHLHSFQEPVQESLALKARAELMLGNHEDCADTLDQLEIIQRDYMEGVNIRGILHMKTKNISEAINIFRSLHLRDPGNPEYILNLAMSYYEAGQFHKAVNYCSSLMDAKSADPRAKRLYDMCMEERKKDYLQKNKITFWRNPLKWLEVKRFDADIIKELKVESIQASKDEERDQKTLYDFMTGALNRKASESYIQGYYVKRTNILFVTMMDVDYFKSFNDCHNHRVGDQVLKALSEVGKQHFPQRFFRYGGEEFIWVFDGNEEDCLKKAEEFRKDVEENVVRKANEIIAQQKIKNPVTKELFLIRYPVTISQGIVQYGEDGNTYETVQHEADTCLYAAKESGRNAIVFRGGLKSKGGKPVKYTKELIAELNKLAESKGKSDWWEYSERMKPKERDEALEIARNVLRDQERMK